MDDKILTAIAELTTKVNTLTGKVDRLTTKVADHQRKLRWITSAALLLVGAIGGPDAVQAVAGTSV